MFYWTILLIVYSLSFYSHGKTCENIYQDSVEQKQIYDLSHLVDKILIEENRCAYASLNKKPKNLIYMFEGRNGFTKELLIEFKKFQRLNPVCKKNPKGGYQFYFSDGTWIDSEHLKGKFDSYVSPKTSGTAVGLKNFIIEGFCQSGVNFNETEIFLWGEDENIELATTCIQQHYWTRYDGTNLPHLIVMGYSRGGARALEFAQTVTALNIKIEKGITVDPVPKKFIQTLKKIPIAFVGIPQAAKPPASFKVPTGVEWVNFWQETDNRWTAIEELGPVGLHGSPVIGAKTNQEVFPKVKSEEKNNGGHWKIFFDKDVKDSIKSIYQKNFIKK